MPEHKLQLTSLIAQLKTAINHEDNENGIKHCLAILKLDPNNFIALYAYIVFSYDETDKIIESNRDTAEKYCRQLVSLCHSDISILTQCMSVLLSANETDENYSSLKECYLNIFKINSKNTDLLLNYANLLLKKKDFTGAKEYYQKILKINEHHTPALNNYGSVLKYEKKYAEAIEYYILAIEKGDLVIAVKNFNSLIKEIDEVSAQEVMNRFQIAYRKGIDSEIDVQTSGFKMETMQ